MVFVIPDMTNDLVTLYVTSWCPFCQRLISALDDAAVPYAAIDVDHDAEAARWQSGGAHSVVFGWDACYQSAGEGGGTEIRPPGSHQGVS